MHQLLLDLLLLALPNLVLGVAFVNPPAFEATTDFSNNPTYEKGSLLRIKWNEQSEDNTSLTLWQLNGTQWLQPFEYLTQNVSGSVTSLDWTVQTTKDLKLSNMFYLCLFVEGDTTSVTNSHYFNITSTDEDDDHDSTTATKTITTGSTQLSPATPSNSPSTTSSGSFKATTTAAAAATATNTSTPDSAGLSSGAKVGVGVGVAVGGLAVIGAAFFAFVRRRKLRRASVPADSVIYAKVHGNEKKPHEIDGRETTRIYELDDNERRELENNERPASSAPAELP
ncbi:hypothetical protein SI65_01250 [Aspergillus cristatus]|uniref:Yeast cell wall synthesis Kre9/Knh1-like N-terminal domain-containing protein n=1 Tax=Aspergillus cristatus TaxID=573508 RepID=A0A1E3BS90_ASPCR|nr:hypothetical protein SI65_01250 [Aspergillus cristatus]